MKKYLLALLGMFVAASLAHGQMPPPTQSKPESDSPAFEPIVARLWSDGGLELVITPNVEKLAPLGLKPADLRFLERRRFVEDEWKVTVKNQEIQLDQLATLKIQKMYVPPFSVDLPDGRQAIITPQDDRIAPYYVPGHYFKEEVCRKLSDLFVEEPGEVTVLTGLRVPGGQIPNFWGTDHIHISMGEPIEHFADVKIQGKRGPQVADLERMKALRKLAESLVEAEQSTPRSHFEEKFGTVPEDKDHYHIYPIAESRIQVAFEGEPSVLKQIFYLEGYSPPPQGITAQARAVAQIDRDFLLAFLGQKYRHTNQQERNELLEFLDSSEPVVIWTADERTKLLELKPATE